MHEPGVRLSLRSLILLTLFGWLSMIGFDFFLHAGLLARLYLTPSPFLLPATSAFRLIPVGYLSFLALALILVWLMTRLQIKRAWPGGVFGLQLGGAIWGALVLGLFSISTAEPLLLLGWFAGQTVELAIGGAVIGSGLAGTSLLRLGLIVLGLLIVWVLLTIGLQALGLAPAIHLAVSV
jgi:hypothetical protein